MNYIGTKIENELTIDQIYTIHYFEYAIDFDFPGELHDFWEGVYVDAGEVTVTYANEKTVMKQGDFFLHKPLEFHSIACNDSVANAIVFSFSSSCEQLYSVADKVIRFGDTEKNLLSKIISEGSSAFSTPLNDIYSNKLEISKASPFGACQTVKNLMELLLINAVRRCYNHTTIEHKLREDSRIKEICAYIQNHIHEPLRFEDVCKKFSVSKTTLKKLFRDNLGCGAMEYYNNCRITEAKKLLREKKYSITEISDILQFSSIHYFSRKFKQATNISPLEYQKSVSSLIKYN
ncbi:MAG: AraC family transcriptional regulator [Acutalibacteraceae bacterium]|nr:AraC family transcriptional regulator [Acutalibacteraceae bacterium]